MNQQQPQKSVHNPGGLLEVHSIFSTIQGEGPFAGYPAIFIRLAGCNLQCPLCDTDYTSGKQLMGPSSIADHVREMANDQPHLVVITGGEPFRQNLVPLIDLLLGDQHLVQIETNGTLYQDLPYEQVVVVCSPKTGSLNKQLMPHIRALKYVLHADAVAEDDGLPLSALNHPCKPRLARPPKGFSGIIYVQPVDEKDPVLNERHLKATVKSVMDHGYVLCLQLHKIINVE